MIFDELWRKQWHRDKLQRFYDKEIGKLAKAKDHREAEELRQEAAHYVHEADQDLDFMRSWMLIKRARRLQVPLPPYSDKQAWHDFWGRISLTPKAYDDLRNAIRKEEGQRLEHRMRWVKEVIIPILSALSVIGSLIVAYTALKLKH